MPRSAEKTQKRPRGPEKAGKRLKKGKDRNLKRRSFGEGRSLGEEESWWRCGLGFSLITHQMTGAPSCAGEP